jgi:hypothetical protein
MERKEHCPVCQQLVKVKMGSYVEWAYFFIPHLNAETGKDCPNGNCAEGPVLARERSPKISLQPELPDLW